MHISDECEIYRRTLYTFSKLVDILNYMHIKSLHKNIIFSKLTWWCKEQHSYYELREEEIYISTGDFQSYIEHVTLTKCKTYSIFYYYRPSFNIVKIFQYNF